MGRILLAHLQDVSLRSLVLASLSAVMLWPAWGRRSAAASHAVWAIVLAGMLLLFATGPILPAIPLRILADGGARNRCRLRRTGVSSPSFSIPAWP